jgi:hypothetical protein
MSLLNIIGYFVINVEGVRRENTTRIEETVKRPAAASL